MENTNAINNLYIYLSEFFAQEKIDEVNTKQEKKSANPNELKPTTSEPNAIEPNRIEPNIPKPTNVEPSLPKPNVPEVSPIQTEVEIRPIKPPPIVTKTYQDVSKDIGATYQSPTPMNEYEARIKIPAHERGHIIRAVGRALVMRREIEYAYVKIRWVPDPRTNRMIVGGGVARVKVGGPIVDLKV